MFRARGVEVAGAAVLVEGSSADEEIVASVGGANVGGARVGSGGWAVVAAGGVSNRATSELGDESTTVGSFVTSIGRGAAAVTGGGALVEEVVFGTSSARGCAARLGSRLTCADAGINVVIGRSSTRCLTFAGTLVVVVRRTSIETDCFFGIDFLAAIVCLAASIVSPILCRCASCSPGEGKSKKVSCISSLCMSDCFRPIVVPKPGLLRSASWSAASTLLLRWISPAVKSIMERSSGMDELERMARCVPTAARGCDGILSRTTEYCSLLSFARLPFVALANAIALDTLASSRDRRCKRSSSETSARLLRMTRRRWPWCSTTMALTPSRNLFETTRSRVS